MTAKTKKKPRTAPGRLRRWFRGYQVYRVGPNLLVRHRSGGVMGATTLEAKLWTEFVGPLEVIDG